MKKYILKYKYTLIFSILIGIIEGIVYMKFFLHMGNAVDSAVLFNIKSLLREGLIALLFLLLSQVTHILYMNSILKFQGNTSNKLREDILLHLYKKPLSIFYKKSTDYYFNLLDEDIDELRKTYFISIPLALTGITQIIIASYTLFSIHYWLFVLSLIFSVLPMGVSRLFIPKINKIVSERSNTNEKYLGSLHEVLEGYETIKRSNKSNKFLSVFLNNNSERMKSIISLNLWNNISQRAMFGINGLSQLLIISIGGYLVAQQKLTAGLLVSSISILTNNSDFISNTTQYLIQIKSSKPLLSKFTVYLHEFKEVELNQEQLIKNIKNNDYGDSSIKISDLTFSFDDKNIFDNFDYFFQPYKCYAVIGESGSGKSTLSRLITKYYSQYGGSIKLFEKDIKDLDESEIYSKVATVPQNPFIFKDSLFNNIVMYKDDINVESELYNEVLQKSNLTELSKRFKNNSDIDSNSLSGGEKQRISIARALIQSPKILIFDEPTTGLDPDNEVNINNIIFSLKDITRIVITHNWSKEFLKEFDNVINLNTMINEEKRNVVS